MAELIRMPKMSDTMTEGVIADWHKKVGDTVKSGDVLAEVETDKATMDLEAYDEGTLLYIGVEKGQSVPIDAIIAVVGAAGEDFQALLDGGATNGQAKTETPAPAEAAAKLQGAAPEKPATTELPDPQAAAAAPAANVNATVIRMPKMSDTMTEGTLVTWLKKEGDLVKAGDALAEVETDKATMDLEAYEEGTLLYIGVKEGQSVAVDDIIAVVGEKGANFKVLVEGGGSAAPASGPPAPAAPATNGQASNGNGQPTAAQNPQADEPAGAATDLSYAGGKGDGAPSDQPSGEQAPAEQNGRVKASPLAKAIAEEKGINLTQVHGTGPEGRIIKKDVETFTPSTQPTAKPATPATAPQPAAKPAAPAPAAQPTAAPAAQPIPQPTAAGSPVTQGEYEDIPVSQMRRVIARRLSESMYTAPHFYLTMEINMDKAMALRTQVNGIAPVKISFNDFVIKAAALALKQHPAVNASWLAGTPGGDKIRRYSYVNIGVAVAIEDGLLVPVVRNADQKTLSTIAAEVKDLAGKAKDRKLQPKDWEGSTFSISNLGMFGIDDFTAIINPPDACIMAIGAIKESVRFEDGTAKPTNVMKVTLSCDHRAVDGASGAAFLQTFKGLLEDPMRMLV